MRSKTIVIIGPTASGKTQLAIDIANKTGKNIVNCDSRQFWDQLSILSCAPTEEELKQAPHFLFNCLPINEKPSLGWWINNIQSISDKILVGGNVFYILSLLKGVPIFSVALTTLEKIKNISEPYNYLKENNFNISNISINDHYRINRALEFFLETGCTSFDQYEYKYTESLEIIFLKPNLSDLINNIHYRTQLILDQSIEEVKITDYHPNCDSIIGYSEIKQYLSNQINYQELHDLICLRTFQYSKKQIKFMRNLEKVYKDLNFQFSTFNID